MEQRTKVLQSNTVKVAVLAGSRLANSLVGLAFAIVLARIFTKEDYGTYRQTLLVFLTISPLFVLGFPQTLLYFLSKNQVARKNTLASNLVIVGILGLIAMVLIATLGRAYIPSLFNNPALEKTLYVLGPYAFFMLILTSFSPCMLAYGRILTAGVFELSSKVLMLCMGLIGAMVLGTPAAVVGGSAVAMGIAVVVALWLMFRYSPTGRIRIQKSMIKMQVLYALPVAGAVIFDRLNLDMDKIVVSVVADDIEQYAIYVNGAIEIPIVGAIAYATTGVLIPALTKLHDAGDFRKAGKLWASSSQKCFAILFPMAIFCLIMAEEIMTVLFSEEYAESKVPFRWYVLILPMRAFNFGAGFLSLGLGRLLVKRAMIGLILNIIMTYMMVNAMGPVGAAISTVIIFYFWLSPYSFLVLSKYWKHSLSELLVFKRLLTIGLCGLGAGTVFLLVPVFDEFPTFVRLCIFGSLYGVVLATLYYYTGLIKFLGPNQLLTSLKIKS